ncbi:sporulation protein YunB [Bacillus timonensis]|nr:sporulation protein YunB [Bacillus timonensis]
MPRGGPLPFRYVFLLTFVFFIFSTAAGLWIINKGIEPTLMRYAENETKRIATLVIKNAITKQINEDELNQEELVIIEKDANGKITSAGFNTSVIQRVLAKTTNNVERYLKFVNEGNIDALELPDVEIEKDEKTKREGFFYEIPLGQATNNALLGNLGPRVPVRFFVIGDVMSDVKTEVEPFGINNALYKISIHLEVSVQVIIPFSTKEIVVPTNIPIVLRSINGDVPQYYNNGGDDSPALELPGN